MKKLRFALVAFTALTLMVSSCKKDEDTAKPSTPAPTPSKSDLLTAKSWKMSAMEIKGINVYAFMKECEKDNFITFKKEGVYVEDEGATKCNSSDNQTENGTWKLIENQTKLILDGDTMVIVSLTAAELKVTSTFDEGGVPETAKTTFVAK